MPSNRKLAAVQTPADSQPVCPSVLTPSVVIQTYDDTEWERFVLECMEGFDPPYVFFDRIGGPGDKGRDIVAYTGQPNTNCDLDVYQCKHYAHPIQPNEIWRELGKLCVYTNRGDYRVPRRYQIVAPQGVGGKLGELLTKPSELRDGLIKTWDARCRDKISVSEVFALEGSLLEYVKSFDFGIVGYVPVNELLKQHRRTASWHHRFKRDYPVRPPADQTPDTVQSYEFRYIRQLFDAYADHLGIPVPDLPSLATKASLVEHFHRSRTDFFMADSLNRFYRDQFPEGAFDHVKKQILDGVIDTTNAPHADAVARVRATVQQAAQLSLASTDYTPYVEPSDKKGVCHHLANDDKLTWVQP